MVPPKLGNVWEPRIYVTIGKITWPAILDLGLSVCVLPKFYVIILIYHLLKSVILT
jgi:hypothetical protein